MQFNDTNELIVEGFTGFTSICELQQNNCLNVSDAQGVYFVVRPFTTPPQFLLESIGGHFKGRNPTKPVEFLEENWVESAIVLYIGKAIDLQTRIRKYMRYGQGNPVGHEGGRLIWQLNNSSSLVICWKNTPNEKPRCVETQYMKDFKNQYGRLPFANLRH